jgi:hypothetical protein
VGLRKSHDDDVISVTRPYLSAKLLDAADDLGHVTTLVQVDGLEEAGLGYTVVLAERQEGLNVLHLRIALPNTVILRAVFKLAKVIISGISFI